MKAKYAGKKLLVTAFAVLMAFSVNIAAIPVQAENFGLQGENQTRISAPTEGLLYELIDKRDDDNNFIYDAEGNKVQVVQITGMSQAASQLVIPAEIDGYPVEVIGTGAFEEQAISEVIFPDTIIEIKLEAFKNCNLLTSVKLPKSLKMLGDDAFGSCVRLTEVWIPKSLEKCGYEFSSDHILEVDKGPFIDCDNLKTVEFEEGTNIIADELFANCKGLEKIEIPDTVTEIESSAFVNCVNLREIIFAKENNLELIGSLAFKGCIGLTSADIPDSVKRIETYAFSECSALKDVKLSKVEALGGGAFYDCDSLESIVIPKTLLKVPSSVTIGATNAQFVFSECDRLKNITFEDGLTEIADGLLYKCQMVESIVLPDSVTLIGSKAFYKCSALREIKLSAQLEEIETKAFEGCSALTDMKFPESLKKIGNYTFRDCISLKNVDLSKLEEIGGGAFYNCDSLESIEIPRTLVKTSSAELGYTDRLIFTECENLKNITFENGTAVIANGVLNDCKCVEELDLPTTVQSISANAFSKCTNLKKITIRQKVNDIHEKAFANVDLEQLTIYGFTGSCAEEYAATYGIEFVSIGELTTGFGTEDVYRIEGADRYETSLEAAKLLKEQLCVDKFSAVILADGRNFPDALAGSYLAGMMDAPILMIKDKAKYVEPLKAFIEENLNSGGTIYVLGGQNAIPDNVLQGLDDYEIKRLAGDTRYETNLLILNEAGITNEEILVCTGKDFADSLSASATKRPILLVKSKLTLEQQEFLNTYKSNKKYIIGGVDAVSADVEKALGQYGFKKGNRLAGKGRYETSILVAETFFEQTDAAVLAYASNFPDGLSGGPLAMSKNAPLILTIDRKMSIAEKYTKDMGIKIGAVLGGNGLISDNAVKNIFKAEFIVSSNPNNEE